MNIGDVVYCEGYGGKDGRMTVEKIHRMREHGPIIVVECWWFDGRRCLHSAFTPDLLSDSPPAAALAIKPNPLLPNGLTHEELARQAATHGMTTDEALKVAKSNNVILTTTEERSVVDIMGLRYNFAAMSQATPTSDARHAVAAEQVAEPPAVCPIGHDKLTDPCRREYCGCGCTACRKMCGEV